MPGMNGIEFLEKIRKMKDYVSTPVIFLSSVKDQKIINLATGYNILAWLNKPMKIDKIKDLIEKIQNT